MKKYLYSLVAVIMLSSCSGTFRGLTNNFNNQNTVVQLSQKNYKVIGYVSGEATATYLFGIGGLARKTLVEQAKSEMFKKAELDGGAKAIVNMGIETTNKSILGIYNQTTITAYGHVVEFLE
ncbi:MAG: lipoprotein [Bacteroidia bacterium]|nr:lipoprotein [Bacteroidia bacterium]